jgi:DNA repair exonuclease SbcCD ATPase subunit
MRILKLQAENVKRLRAVEITPDGNLVVVSGRNEQGKTSVLDAIWFALGGGPALRGTPKPIRDGEDAARVTLDLGALIVTRKWTSDDKSYLSVSTRDGAQYKSPQGILDDLVGSLSFDPLAFTQMTPADQRDTLQALIGFDPTELDEARTAAYESRTDINRDIQRVKGTLFDLPETPEGLPDAEISIRDVATEYEGAVDQKRENDKWREQLSMMEQESKVREATMRRLRAEHEVAREELASLERRVDDLVDPDLDAMLQRVNDTDETNAKIRTAAQRVAVEKDLQQILEASAKLSSKIYGIDAEKAAALQDADMPIDGLTIEDTGVTYHGIPFAQCSGAERLRVSLAMAMAINPKLRVIRIMDGNLLDRDNLKMIADLAETNDYQIWMERIDDTSAGSVVIEDGSVQESESGLAGDQGAKSG